MNSLNHTPTPWRVGTFYDRGPGDAHLGIYAEYDQTKIAVVEKWKGDATPESEANAQFIVTACNQHALLIARNAELRDIVERFVHRIELEDRHSRLVDKSDIMDQARAALTRANSEART